MKGQIFTLDAFLSVLLFTVMLGMFAMQFEQVQYRAENLNYIELQTLANDWSQIAVKNTLVKDNYTGEIGADSAHLDVLSAQMNGSIRPPFYYEVTITGSTPVTIKSSIDCTGMSNVAVTRRIVTVDGTQQNLTVKICA